MGQGMELLPYQNPYLGLQVLQVLDLSVGMVS